MNNEAEKNGKNTRLSGVQKDVMFILYGLAERKQLSGPILGMTLFNILNKGQLNVVADSNFQRSCHTLAEHSLLSKYRDRQSLKLAFSLTATGIEIAQDIYRERIEEIG